MPYIGARASETHITLPITIYVVQTRKPSATLHGEADSFQWNASLDRYWIQQSCALICAYVFGIDRKTHVGAVVLCRPKTNDGLDREAYGTQRML